MGEIGVLSEVASIYQRLSGVGFGALLFIMLVGSYYESWVWGRRHRRELAAKDGEIATLKAEKERWETAALRAHGILKDSVGVLAKIA